MQVSHHCCDTSVVWLSSVGVLVLVQRDVKPSREAVSGPISTPPSRPQPYEMPLVVFLPLGSFVRFLDRTMPMRLVERCHACWYTFSFSRHCGDVYNRSADASRLEGAKARAQGEECFPLNVKQSRRR